MVEEVRPFRVVAKIKNNRLWRAILEKFPDVTSQLDASRKLQIHPTVLGNWLNIKVWPYAKKGAHYNPQAVRIAGVLGEPVEYLFDPKLYGKPPIDVLEIEVGPLELVAPERLMLTAPQIEDVSLEELKDALNSILESLTPREQAAVRWYYGINSDDEQTLTLDEIAANLGISKERVRQIIMKAFGKIKSRAEAKGLDDFVEKRFDSESAKAVAQNFLRIHRGLRLESYEVRKYAEDHAIPFFIFEEEFRNLGGKITYWFDGKEDRYFWELH